MNNGLHLVDFQVRLGGALLADLSLQVPQGEILTVMGPSGSGKSTLLAALTGTLAPGFATSGQVVLNGRDITGLAPQARRLGLLFQDDLLFPHMSVAGNLAFALPSQHRKDRQARIEAALQDMGLAGFGPRMPATLSGGQRARVALARCLLSEPEALLLDEPFSRLDADLRDQIRSLTFAHARAKALPMILVTHDREDADAAGGAVISPLGLAAPRPDRP